jgi:hypothetical protein
MIRLLITVSALAAAAPSAVLAKEHRVDPGDYAAVTAAITKTIDKYSGYRDVTGPKVYRSNSGRPLYFEGVDAVTTEGDTFALLVTGEFTGDVQLTGAAANGHSLKSQARDTQILACDAGSCLRRVGITILLDRNTIDDAMKNGFKFRVYTATTGVIDMEAPA